MEDALYDFYRKVLYQFPFSITGYHYPEKEYEKSFRNFCEHLESIGLTDKLGFVISGFAQLDSVLSNSKDLLEWKTKPLSKFLFNDLHHGTPEPILSLYITCLQRYSPGRMVVNILAGNVRSELSIRVNLSSDAETIDVTSPMGTELIITVPSFLFRVPKGKMDGVFRDNHTAQPMVTARGGNGAYELAEGAVDAFSATLEEVLDYEKAHQCRSSFSHASSQKVAKLFNNASVNEDELFSFIYASALLCWFYDSDLTYFVSTARQDGKNRFTLGAMGLGVRSDKGDLSKDYRALCHMFVNHVAANLSTRIVYDAYKDFVREKNREEMRMAIDAFHAIGEERFHHGAQKWSDEGTRLIEDWLNRQVSILSPFFKERFMEIKGHNDGIVTKYCLTTLRPLSDKCDECTIKKYKSIFSTDLNACCLVVSSHPYFNVPFIEALFAQFITPRDGNLATHVMSAVGNDLVLDIEYSKGFDLSGFIRALKSFKKGSSLVGTFFGTYYPLLDCHGVLDISVPLQGNHQSVFNSRHSVLRSGKDGLVLDNAYKFPTGLPGKTKSLRLRFTNELSDWP